MTMKQAMAQAGLPLRITGREGYYNVTTKGGDHVASMLNTKQEARRQMVIEREKLRARARRWFDTDKGQAWSKSKGNPGKVVRLKNFTGVVRLNPNKTVSVVGRKKRSAKKR